MKAKKQKKHKIPGPLAKRDEDREISALIKELDEAIAAAEALLAKRKRDEDREVSALIKELDEVIAAAEASIPKRGDDRSRRSRSAKPAKRG
jgi:hypothetical protein